MYSFDGPGNDFARASPLRTKVLKHFAQSRFLIHLKQKIMDNKPTHYLYNVIDHDNTIDDEKRGIWTRIGAAWPHGDKKGFSITLDIPMVVSHKTRLVLREREEQPETPETPEKEANEATLDY